MAPSKNTTHKEYVHGDFDKDGTPNIDDNKPFDKSDNSQVDKDIRFSDTLKHIDNQRDKAHIIGTHLQEKHGVTGFRVKSTFSTLNKLVKKNPHLTNDFIGLRGVYPNRKVARNQFNKVKQTYSLKSTFQNKKKSGNAEWGHDNKYQTLSRSKNPYRAYHSNFKIGGYGVEIQQHTKPFNKMAGRVHRAYKQGKNLSKFVKMSKKFVKSGY